MFSLAERNINMFVYPTMFLLLTEAQFHFCHVAYMLSLKYST